LACTHYTPGFGITRPGPVPGPPVHGIPCGPSRLNFPTRDQGNGGNALPRLGINLIAEYGRQQHAQGFDHGAALQAGIGHQLAQRERMGRAVPREHLRLNRDLARGGVADRPIILIRVPIPIAAQVRVDAA
jgi:hypothetical protein